MNGAPSPEMATLLDECTLGIELHSAAVGRVRSLAALLALGQSMQEVAGVVLHRLCNDDPADARQYLRALQEVIASDLNVLLMYVQIEALETKNPKA